MCRCRGGSATVGATASGCGAQAGSRSALSAGTPTMLNSCNGTVVLGRSPRSAAMDSRAASSRARTAWTSSSTTSPVAYAGRTPLTTRWAFVMPSASSSAWVRAASPIADRCGLVTSTTGCARGRSVRRERRRSRGGAGRGLRPGPDMRRHPCCPTGSRSTAREAGAVGRCARWGRCRRGRGRRRPSPHRRRAAL